MTRTALIALDDEDALTAPTPNGPWSLIITPDAIDHIRGTLVDAIVITPAADRIPRSVAQRIVDTLRPALLTFGPQSGYVDAALDGWVSRTPDDIRPAKPARPRTLAIRAGELKADHIGLTIDVALDDFAHVVDRLGSVEHREHSTLIRLARLSDGVDGRFLVEPDATVVVTLSEVD